MEQLLWKFTSLYHSSMFQSSRSLSNTWFTQRFSRFFYSTKSLRVHKEHPKARKSIQLSFYSTSNTSTFHVDDLLVLLYDCCALISLFIHTSSHDFAEAFLGLYSAEWLAVFATRKSIRYIWMVVTSNPCSYFLPFMLVFLVCLIIQ